MGWILEQLSNPVVAAVVAFVLGGAFTSLVELVSSEVRAGRDDQRRRRAAALEHRLSSVRLTQRYVWSVSEFALRRHISAATVEALYDPVEFAGARVRYVSDAQLLNDFHRALVEVFQRPLGLLRPDDAGRFSTLRDRMLASLEDAEERLVAGEEPPVTPRSEFDEEAYNRALSIGHLEVPETPAAHEAAPDSAR